MHLAQLTECRSFAQLVRSQRLKLGFSTAELAKIFTFNLKVIEGWESGTELPSVLDLWTVCEVLDIEPAELVWALAQNNCEPATSEENVDDLAAVELAEEDDEPESDEDEDEDEEDEEEKPPNAAEKDPFFS